MESRAVCPNCENEVPEVGQPCPQAVCNARGYRGIPRNWFEAARQWCQRKGRPLDPLLGRRLDRYLLAGKLGEGGMGAVYLALQEPLMREVALKLVSGLELNPASEARFEREARTISALDHPNIVKLYDYGIGDLGFRVPYMALEYVRHGRTLRQVFPAGGLGRDPAVGTAEILTVFEQVLHALGAAHDQGIVHRDVKPENVMVAPVHGNPWFVKVLDFGLAKVLEHPSRLEISRTGQPMGTPLYMAPEQAYGEALGPVDGRVDLYAVGVMIFEVLTGTTPFPGDTSLAILTRKVDPRWNPLDQPEARDLPRVLQEFLVKALRPRPEDRFPRASEMLVALQEAFQSLSGHPWRGYGPRTFESEDRPSTPPSPPGEGPSDGLHDGRTLPGIPVVPSKGSIVSVPDLGAASLPAVAVHPRDERPDRGVPDGEPIERPVPIEQRMHRLRRTVPFLLSGASAIAIAMGLLWRSARQEPGPPSPPAGPSRTAKVVGTSRDDGSASERDRDVFPGAIDLSVDGPEDGHPATSDDRVEDPPGVEAPEAPPTPRAAEDPRGVSRPLPPRKPPVSPKIVRPTGSRRPPVPAPDPPPEPPPRKFHLK